jgi:hypothetical protein
MWKSSDLELVQGSDSQGGVSRIGVGPVALRCLRFDAGLGRDTDKLPPLGSVAAACALNRCRNCSVCHFRVAPLLAW